MSSALIALALLVAVLVGTPLFAVIAASALLGFHFAGIDLQVVIIEIHRLSEMPVLLAIPLFTLAGYLLGESGAPRRLVRLSNALLGWLPGGLAIVALVLCALFTAFTGASGITIVALGALLYPALRDAGYGDRFSLGLVTSSGSLGILFAPSLPLILYAVIAQQMNLPIQFTVDQLFLAGLLPGLLMLIVLSAWSAIHGRMHAVREREREPTSLCEVGAAIVDARWELPLPIVVLGGIYGGFIGVSEAAALAAAWVLLAVLVRQEIPWQEMPRLVREAMQLVGAILLILGVSLASTNVMIFADVPGQVFAALETLIDSRWMFLLLLFVLLLILGMILDIFSALVIMVPLILPLALAWDVHPLHLGVLFLATMQIGYFTPPVGMNLFIASFRFNKPVMELYRATLPFFFLLLACALIITFWPALSLWLPSILD